ncbi:MAG: cellulase family glycosylhydrolase [Spirochaetia bacterium]|jgi:hypothetical protein
MSTSSTDFVPSDAVGKPLPPLPGDKQIHGRQWSAERSNAWYAGRPWIAGANFVPRSAINELEMWQADTFDPDEIDREMGLAEELGFNAMRTFLHDLAWKEDPAEFFSRVDRYLQIASRHGIATMLVLFDSVWDPDPHAGRQHDPVPGRHNSGWVQSPGGYALSHVSEYPRLESYVKQTIQRYARDPRVLAWDIMNEPDNTNRSSYAGREPADKTIYAYRLLVSAYGWAREIDPDQPITAGVWHNEWGQDMLLLDFERFQLTSSDIIMFHCYDPPAEMSRRIMSLNNIGRPLICTEYMARPRGSTFQAVMPHLKKEKVGAINWGFVSGKSQTIYPWDSWQQAYPGEPKVWFHDIFRGDGTPYSADETELIRSLTGPSAPK